MKKIFVFIVLVSVLASCKKSFITIKPESTASVDDVYKTDKDFHDAVVAMYATLRNQYQDFWIYGDLRADDSWHALGNDAFLVSVNTFSMSSSAALMINSWRNYYAMINRANMILSKIDGVDAATVPGKDQYVAEAKFIRAFAYFDMVRIWGDVPLITKPITIAEGYKAKREKVSNIYSQLIIPDMLAAESKLPAKYGGADVGRPTKGAATSMLGRIYLTIKDFANAETKLQAVTGMGYALLPNYNDLWNYTKDEHHSEYIFDVEYQDGGLG
ncbi:MAG TPA: RagB/SusD family nutrient uptake outer membrane protein, partial [Puia sp.]